MEKFIKRNQGKIFLICAIFTMWCFYTVVKGGGAVMPRIQTLETDLDQTFKALHYKLIKHDRSIHYGRYPQGKPLSAAKRRSWDKP